MSPFFLVVIVFGLGAGCWFRFDGDADTVCHAARRQFNRRAIDRSAFAKGYSVLSSLRFLDLELDLERDVNVVVAWSPH